MKPKLIHTISILLTFFSLLILSTPALAVSDPVTTSTTSHPILAVLALIITIPSLILAAIIVVENTVVMVQEYRRGGKGKEMRRVLVKAGMERNAVMAIAIGVLGGVTSWAVQVLA